MSALPLDLFIEVNSTGVKDTFTIGKLPTLLITKARADLPMPQFSQFTNLSAIKNAFKAGSVVDFATEYFGFVSKNATKADYLSVFSLNDSDLPAMLKGAKCAEVGVLKTLNGKVKVTIDGESHDVAFDLTGATSLSDIANTMQIAITGANGAGAGFTSAEVEYNSLTQGFVVKSGTKGNTSTISYFSKADDGEDIHGKLGLSKGEGAEILAGQTALSLADALNIIEQNNGNYYLITFDYEFDNIARDLAVFGKWVNASAGRFAGLYSDGKLLNETLTDIHANDGLILDLKLAENQNGVVSAYISSLDLSKANSNVNIAFNDASQFASNAITDRTIYEKMTTQKLNAPSKFGILGQDDTIYMDGTICGTLTNSINVYVCNSFIKMNEQIQLYNMLKSSKIIGLRDAQSRNAINGYITEVFENAVSARMIAVGAELTTTEKSVLAQTFGGIEGVDMNDVFNQIEKYGYYFKPTDMNVVKKELTITQAYIANTPLKKLVVANYILGA